MPSITFFLFFVWVIALLLAIWALRVAQVFNKRMLRNATRPLEEFLPNVAVILPIKGVDEDTPQNLAALLGQDYPNYRLIFAVEADDDPVLAILERYAREDSRIEIVVAGTTHKRGQKIHNQLAAISRTTPEDEVLVFVDADARPGPTWLRALTEPLGYGDHIGATTGFRFYVPVGPHTANAIVSVINAGVAALLGPYRRTFAWGGSMAIRRKDFFGFGVHEAWQNAVSDDYVLSWCVKHQAGKKIHFVPRCLVASTANFNWGSFFEFACRQYRITKVCALNVWLTAVLGALVYLAAIAYTVVGLVYSLFRGPVDYNLIPMFIALYALGIARGHQLLTGARQSLPEHFPQLQKVAFWYTWGYPFVVLVNFVALLGSGVGREIVWRGVGYTMLSRTRTRVHRPELPQAPTPAPHYAEADER